MDRVSICNRIGNEYKTENVENGEYSYVKAAGSMKKLTQALGYKPNHFKLDIRFEHNGVVILVETKQAFTRDDELQLSEYLLEEKAIHNSTKIICILANTSNDSIRVWKSEIDDAHLLQNESVLDNMAHYEALFEVSRQNDREAVLKNTYALNATLHKYVIKEDIRSQFVGTAYLYIQDVLRQQGIAAITHESRQEMKKYWNGLSANQIRSGIEDTLSKLLDGSDNKELKINLLQHNVLENKNIKKLDKEKWIKILDEIVGNIYKYINEDSSEGQDILNLFFVAFNKYARIKDKNQAFTPDHITNFMCRVVGVDRTKRIFDGTCGSGSFLVQGMVLELADCNRMQATNAEKVKTRESIKKNNIYGIESDDNIYGLATTNMLIHGDGNSNVIHGDLFKNKTFFKQADPDIVLMNPPYNSVPEEIPKSYSKNWKSEKWDPTKGMVFLKFISDVVEEMNNELLSKGQPAKEVKVAILLPVATAIGSNSYISDMKKKLLEKNTLDAVFSLPNEIFYPGASASACCMVFTLGKPHILADGTKTKTFFGFYKDDGHKKKKNLGRVEQFDKITKQSIWKQIEEEWLDLYRNKTVKDGMSALHAVTGDDEWLCEAYMKTDYSKLSEADFQQTLNNYLAYLMKEGKIYGA